MRKVREVLRQKLELEMTHALIAASTGISPSTVSDYLKRARTANLSWEQIREMSDAEVERRLFKQIGYNEPTNKARIDFEWVHRELRRTGVTLQLLWNEYSEAAAGESAKPYGYSQFCELYRSFRKKVEPAMRQTHRAGEKGFVDYSGKKPVVVDPDTGEATEVELFVMVLGASNYTYAEATQTQQSRDFIGSHIRAFEYFGCVPKLLVPDQLRSAVAKPHRYDPELNRTYYAMAEHYDTAIVPARPRRPKDKAKAEAGVLLAQRWILACLRNRVFFCLDDLNEAIAHLLERLNTRPFQKLEGCRRSAFEQIDRPAMKPLPLHRYEVAEWKNAKVGIDYHVQYDWRYYSGPFTLRGEGVEVRATSATVEILHSGQRVASHRRSYGRKGTAVTCEEHRPKSHRDYGQWTPARMVQWAGSIGPCTAEVVERILDSHRHPEMGYRSCLGLIRRRKTAEDGRLEAACRRALEINSPNRRSVEMILKKGLDKLPQESQSSQPLPLHDNIRGSSYYEGRDGEDNSDEESDGHNDEQVAQNSDKLSPDSLTRPCSNNRIACNERMPAVYSRSETVNERTAALSGAVELSTATHPTLSHQGVGCSPASRDVVARCMSTALRASQLSLGLEE